MKWDELRGGEIILHVITGSVFGFISESVQSSQFDSFDFL